MFFIPNSARRFRRFGAPGTTHIDLILKAAGGSDYKKWRPGDKRPSAGGHLLLFFAFLLYCFAADPGVPSPLLGGTSQTR